MYVHHDGGSDNRGEEGVQRSGWSTVTCKLWYTLGYTRKCFENQLEVEICITDIYFHLPLLSCLVVGSHWPVFCNPEKLLRFFFFFFPKRRMEIDKQLWCHQGLGSFLSHSELGYWLGPALFAFYCKKEVLAGVVCLFVFMESLF